MCCTLLAGNTGHKNRHFGTIAQLCRANMVNFGLLTAEICWWVWGTPANFNGFCILAALLHGTLVVGVSQTLRRWTEGATYIWQGGHHVGHWPTFLVFVYVLFCVWLYIACMCSIVTWWGGPGGIEAWSLGPLLPSVLWHCWLGHLTRKACPRYDL